jgi:hypothetical protein
MRVSSLSKSIGSIVSGRPRAGIRRIAEIGCGKGSAPAAIDRRDAQVPDAVRCVRLDHVALSMAGHGATDR